MDDAYQAYLQAQCQKTMRKVRTSHPGRIVDLAQLLSVYWPPTGQSLLCVGCRNGYELDILTQHGYCPTGIDLISVDPRIQVMDMHTMSWPTGHFDGLFASHSLEHAFDLTQALHEFQRVVKPGGIMALEVPIQYHRSATDRHDAKSLKGLLAWCRPFTAHILYGDETNRLCGTGYPGTVIPCMVARLILKRV